jgi:methylenetetrahydrofolate reductase (NADPH)
MLRGDDPSVGDQPDAKAVFDLDPRQLLETARRLRDEHELPPGRKITGHAPFYLGAADSPIDPRVAWAPNALAAKLATGAQFVQTQFCMDAGVVRRYTTRLREAGIEGLHLLIGIAPLRSVRSARWMRENLFGTIISDDIVARLEAATDPAAEGVQVCLDLIEEFAAIPGVSGVHVMAPGQDAAVPGVLEQARQRLGR